MDLNTGELLNYQLIVTLKRCSESCNTLDALSEILSENLPNKSKY